MTTSPEIPRGYNTPVPSKSLIPARQLIQAVPGKSRYAIQRLYAPLKPCFEKSWIPNDIEQLQRPRRMP